MPGLGGEGHERPLGGIADEHLAVDPAVVAQGGCLERSRSSARDARSRRSSRRRRSPRSGRPRDRRPATADHDAPPVIWLRVRVPVLSEQMTVVAPRVSTDASRLTMAPRFAIWCTPTASVTVTAGQALGDGGDRERHRRQDRVGEASAPQQPQHEERRDGDRGGHREALAHVELLLQGGARVRGGLEQARQVADLRAHPGGGDEHLAPTRRVTTVFMWAIPARSARGASAGAADAVGHSRPGSTRP